MAKQDAEREADWLNSLLLGTGGIVWVVLIFAACWFAVNFAVDSYDSWSAAHDYQAGWQAGANAQWKATRPDLISGELQECKRIRSVLENQTRVLIEGYCAWANGTNPDWSCAEYWLDGVKYPILIMKPSPTPSSSIYRNRLESQYNESYECQYWQPNTHDTPNESQNYEFVCGVNGNALDCRTRRIPV